MKKRSFICLLLVIVFAFTTLASCKSTEAVQNTAPLTVSAVSDEMLIQNGNFGGILYESQTATAAAAVPIPDNTGMFAPPAVTEQVSAEDTTVPADKNSSDASGDSTTSATTTPAASSGTRSAGITSSSAAETTAQPMQTTTTAATAAQTTTTTTTAAATTTTSAVQTTTTTTAATVTETSTTTTSVPAETGYSGGSYSKNGYQALNHSYVKAVWISYIELGPFYGLGEEQFRSRFSVMMDNCASMGINTVYVHVRAFGDAYYYSELFPFTKKLSRNIGQRCSYDPLKIMVSEAHSRNISFHAWINPLRLGTTAELAATSQDYPTGKWYNGTEKGKYIVNVNGTWFLNPAYSNVRKLIGDNVREIVSRYDVDGVNIDDYFYPTTDASFDSAAFSASSAGSLSEFRINNINMMVKEMYTAAHECGSALFGACPQGNNINNLYPLYADTRAWCAGGYVDYFAPQVYYGFENSGVPFKSNVDEWLGIVRGTKTKLYIGLSLYKAGTEDKWAGAGKYEWINTDTMIKRQIEYAKDSGCNGIVLYCYNYLFTEGYNNAAINKEIANFKPLLTE